MRAATTVKLRQAQPLPQDKSSLDMLMTAAAVPQEVSLKINGITGFSCIISVNTVLSGSQFGARTFRGRSLKWDSPFSGQCPGCVAECLHPNPYVTLRFVLQLEVNHPQ